MNDGRFFPGYVWVSESPDCRLGLCIPGATAAEAARRYADHKVRQWWCRQHAFTVYTLENATATPVRHDVTA